MRRALHPTAFNVQRTQPTSGVARFWSPQLTLSNGCLACDQTPDTPRERGLPRLARVEVDSRPGARAESLLVRSFNVPHRSSRHQLRTGHHWGAEFCLGQACATARPFQSDLVADDELRPFPPPHRHPKFVIPPPGVACTFRLAIAVSSSGLWHRAKMGADLVLGSDCAVDGGQSLLRGFPRVDTVLAVGGIFLFSLPLLASSAVKYVPSAFLNSACS